MHRIRLISLLSVLFCAVIAMAHSGITIKSFDELPQDLDARVSYPELDQNGHKCALLKIVTTDNDFSFDNGLLGVTKVLHKPELSEWWVYLPEKSMKIKITHPVHGQLNDCPDGYFYFPTPLKSAVCYRMELTTQRKIVTYEPARVQTGFLIINSQPEGGDVYLTENGVENYVGTTPFQKNLSYGSYNYRVKKSLYHDEVGLAVIAQSRVMQSVILRPAFGSLKVESNPSGAKVRLEKDTREFTTPCVIDFIESGSHKVNVVAPRYSAFSQEVLIEDGKQTLLNAVLDARFARVSIQSLPGASISVNGQVKGKGSYSEELAEGIYNIEVSLANHRSISRQIDVKAKQPQTITLEPTPIYGSLIIMTEPMFADVTINGKSYGDTPLSIDNILIGDYEVVMSKEGCDSVTRKITIAENNQSSIEVTLPQGRLITIRSDEQGDQVFVDGISMGITPLEANLAFGNHTIELKRGDKTVKQEFSITPHGKHEIILGFGALIPRWSDNVTASQKRILQQLIDDMVAVKGGTFTMGATSEQGSDAYSDEKPKHKVTLSDYMICKTEVTQELWQAVMGYNPSRFKGEKLPVEKVDWYSCQTFISLLNELTGLNFRLPTEAEWEYAARGGKKSKGYKYSGSNYIKRVAWYYDNSSGKTHNVATKAPNELGLYDMNGNVWEFCSDYYGDYSSASQTNPICSYGHFRVIRGGSWDSYARNCRVSIRADNFINQPDFRGSNLGLRLAL